MHHIYHTLFSAIAAHNAAPAHQSALTTAPTSANAAALRCNPSGAFNLPNGRALTLQPHAAAVLRVRQGTAWVTLPSQPGDHFLQAGDTLRVQAGDSVVMEPWQARAHAPAYAHAGAHAIAHASVATEALYFDWDPVPMHIAAPASAVLRERWQPGVAQPAARISYSHAVRQPLADLRAALVLGAGAAGRLAAGFVVWGFGSVVALVLGNGLAARARTAHSSARAAHGRMASGESMASSGAL
jgi:Protein of unknown function (DUF2917)